MQSPGPPPRAWAPQHQGGVCFPAPQVRSWERTETPALQPDEERKVLPAGPAPGPTLGPTEQKSCRPVSHLGAGVTRVALSHYRHSSSLPSAPSRAAAPAGGPAPGGPASTYLTGPLPNPETFNPSSRPPTSSQGQALETTLPAAGWAQTLSGKEGLPHRGPRRGTGFSHSLLQGLGLC